MKPDNDYFNRKVDEESKELEDYKENRDRFRLVSGWYKILGIIAQFAELKPDAKKYFKLYEEFRERDDYPDLLQVS